MGLGKTERRITIAIGLIIGVSVSSMLVKHALDVKEEQSAKRPGNYHSMHSAVGNVAFPPLPEAVKRAVPNGIVVFFEANRTSLSESPEKIVSTWVIETSGSFRSERLFVLAEVDHGDLPKIQFFRASEVYVKLNAAHSRESLEDGLDEEKFFIIGQNSASSEYIVQVRNFSPSDLMQAKHFLQSLRCVQSVRLVPWAPMR